MLSKEGSAGSGSGGSVFTWFTMDPCITGSVAGYTIASVVVLVVTARLTSVPAAIFPPEGMRATNTYFLQTKVR